MTLSKERKYILIGGAILLFSAAIYRYTPSLEGVFTSEQSLSLRQEKLASYRRLAKKRLAMELQLNSLKKSLAWAESDLLTGKTPALAAVEVQNIIKSIVGTKGAHLRTTRVLTPKGEGEGAYVGIPVQITIQSNIRQLKEVLYGIEDSKTLLNIRELRVRTVRRRNQEDQLQSTITVAGFLKK